MINEINNKKFKILDFIDTLFLSYFCCFHVRIIKKPKLVSTNFG